MNCCPWCGQKFTWVIHKRGGENERDKQRRRNNY